MKFPVEGLSRSVEPKKSVRSVRGFLWIGVRPALVPRNVQRSGNANLCALPRQFFEGREQHIDLFFGIVEAEACPYRAIGKAEPFHKRLAAMVA